ncbi:TauD/TfdA family dioxygenase [Methylomicrobium sp. RS1]|uniref:TauD/TfdA family dioxygenase n=1 Tax=Candidatus Methylomicrobium oryzae TaxID=2802053 RepID=UPI00192404DC|nr:TauD/TfdA family dioxygenase [Methylomicrobium sp. RS1]MBL1265171.1 TauD/TfdA family dioxygenase [Methylomicrobium sp. RS1]
MNADSRMLMTENLTASGALPLLVKPAAPGIALSEVAAELRALADRHLLHCGGLLFRGFAVAGPAEFKMFAAGFGHPLLSYEFGSTPRTRVEEGVYTSTEYPPHQSIPLHNEQAYTREWPMKIWFYSALVAERGGETPIADSREIYRRIDPAIRRRFEQHGLMYVRNFGNGLDVPWAQVFNTEEPGVVEQYCSEHGIVCEWKDDGELRTRQICQATAQHPVTGDWVWFNQAHLFHVSNLEPDVREALLDMLEPEDLPRNVYYGDGSPIEDSVLDEIRGVLDELTVSFSWQTGDVMMLDNMLAAHARSPFGGARKVVVAMAEPYSQTLSA